MTVWTDVMKARAAELWNGGQSASEIAVSFGVSRNSVIGIVHRNPDLFRSKPRRAKSGPKGGGQRAAQAVPSRPRRSVFNPPIPRKAVRIELAVRQSRDQAAVSDDMFEAAEPLDPVIESAFAPIRPIPFLKVTDATCRWPLWQVPDNPGAEGLCCGDPTDGASSWCSHHRRRARAA